MKTWQRTAGLAGASEDIRTIHDRIEGAFRKRGEEMPYLMGVASCESDADEHIYEIFFELAPGVVLSTTFGSPEDIEGTTFPTWKAPAAEKAEIGLLVHLAIGVDRLADTLHDLRVRARKRLVALSGSSGSGRLVGIRLAFDDWEVTEGVHVKVRLEGLDEQLRPAIEELGIGDLANFDAAIAWWARSMADRFRARRALAIEGATGSIDLLTLNAISTFSDPAEWLRGLSSTKWPPTPDEITIFPRNGAFRSHGRDLATGLSWNRDTVQYSTFVPHTVLLARVGRPITDLIEHPMLSKDMIILDATCSVDGGEATTSIDIAQPRMLFCVNSGRTWSDTAPAARGTR